MNGIPHSHRIAPSACAPCGISPAIGSTVDVGGSPNFSRHFAGTGLPIAMLHNVITGIPEYLSSVAIFRHVSPSS